MLRQLLTNHGVLGMNARNFLYVSQYNKKSAKRFADDKLKTKAFLTARGIPAAKIYARIERREQLQQFDFNQLPDECVLKPNYGFGGEGIVILKGRTKDGRFLRSGKTPISKAELIEAIEDILDGKFSLGGHRDTAFFEQILTSHDCFARLRPAGLPDLRVIVFNLVPVMAMVRIPTGESEGKANVHLGGIGIGIDIAKGVTTHATQYNKIITELPHGGSPSDISIPYWDEILLICSRIQQVTNIGYLAADITIDQQMGPAVLEVNARPGLMVQVANLAPLRGRLDRVKGLSVSSPEKGVRIGQDLFGEKVRTVTEEVPAGKPVLGLHEHITIVGDGTSADEAVLIAPERERTVCTAALADALLEKKLIDVEDAEERTYRMKCTLGGVKLQTLLAVSDEDFAENVSMVIGRRDLTNFLIDPGKQSAVPAASTELKSDLRAVDTLFAQLDRDLLLLKYLKPVNLDEERERLQEDMLYNPLFSYPALEFDPEEVRERLSNAVQDDSPLGVLLEKKRQELLLRIDLLTARGDAKKFTKASIALFGKPSSGLTRSASAMLQNRKASELPPPADQMLTAAQAAERFQRILARYSLHDWQVSVRSKLVADCTVGGKHVYLRQGAMFAPSHVEGLIKHEIETHVLTAENGDHQPYAIFRRGTAGYLDTQEGLAVYNQNRVYGPYHDKRYNPARNVLGVRFNLEHSFAETRAYLQEELGYTAEKSLTGTIAMKRGLTDTSEIGGFTKSIVYLRGLRAVEKFVKGGGDLQRLYIGKITLDDLELIESVSDLETPLLIPDFLREEMTS